MNAHIDVILHATVFMSNIDAGHIFTCMYLYIYIYIIVLKMMSKTWDMDTTTIIKHHVE